MHDPDWGRAHLCDVPSRRARGRIALPNLWSDGFTRRGAMVGVKLRPYQEDLVSGALSLWRDYATVALRARQLAWDEIDARRVGEERLTELVAVVNGLSSERQKTAALTERVHALEAEIAVAGVEAARLRDALAHVRARLAFRESFVGWLRWPLT